MKVVTIATDLDNAFLNELLIPSCGAVGLDLVVLHSNKEFQLRDKRVILANYLARRGEPDDELLVFTDAYDTVFVQGERYISEAYAGLPQTVVFGAELNSWPLTTIGMMLHDGPPVRPYPYLNSGAFIGRASDILDLYTKYPNPPSDQFRLLQHLRRHDYDTDERFDFSDQYYWVLVQLLESDRVGLDHHAVLFENFGPSMVDAWDPKVIHGISEYLTHGKGTAAYQEDRARLEDRLRSPSRAAQLHFGNPISKAVVLDLLAEGQLPDWVRLDSAPSAARVEPVSY